MYSINKNFTMKNFQIYNIQKTKNTLKTLILFSLFITMNLSNAQENKDSKFDIIAYGGIGYGAMDSENEPSYNLNSNSIDILLNYKLNEKFGIATGIGMYQLSGNGFNSFGNFYQERRLLKIPLLGTLKMNISNRLTFTANFGLFTQVITKDTYEFLSSTHNDIYDGWNFGAQAGVGFIYNLTKKFGIGLQYMERYEINKFKTTNNNIGLSDSQLINNRNSIGVLFMFTI